MLFRSNPGARSETSVETGEETRSRNPSEPRSETAADRALDAGLPRGEGRRWLALRDGPLLLGALRVDARCWPWPTSLSERLEATARCLTEALRLDLEQQRLGLALAIPEPRLCTDNGAMIGAAGALLPPDTDAWAQNADADLKLGGGHGRQP